LKREEQQLAMMQTLKSMQTNMAGDESPPEQNVDAEKEVVEEKKPAEKKSPETEKEEVLKPEIVKPFFQENEKISSNFDLDETKEITEEIEHEDLSLSEIADVVKENDKLVETKNAIKEGNMNICKHPECEKAYIKGDGFGKTKGSLNFDLYCSKKCMSNDINTKNQANRIKKNK
jgi:hypothetical protein